MSGKFKIIGAFSLFPCIDILHHCSHTQYCIVSTMVTGAKSVMHSVGSVPYMIPLKGIFRNASLNFQHIYVRVCCACAVAKRHAVYA